MFNPLAFDSVVILGGSGYVGSTLVCELKGTGTKVLSPSSSDINLTDEYSVNQMINCFSSNTAVVFSACISPDRSSNSETFLNNVCMAHFLSQAIKTRAPAYLIYLSANGVYEDYQSPCMESSLPTPQSLYGMMHLSREHILSQTCRETDTPLMILRPGSIYGPKDLHDYYGPTRFLRTALADGYIELFGGGEELRDYVNIQDVVRVICLCLRGRTIGTLNISSGQPRTFKEIAFAIVNLLDNSVEIRSIPRVSGRVISHRQISAEKLLKTFPSLKLFSIEEAMTSMLKSK